MNQPPVCASWFYLCAEVGGTKYPPRPSLAPSWKCLSALRGFETTPPQLIIFNHHQHLELVIPLPSAHFNVGAKTRLYAHRLCLRFCLWLCLVFCQALCICLCICPSIWLSVCLCILLCILLCLCSGIVSVSGFGFAVFWFCFFFICAAR